MINPLYIILSILAVSFCAPPPSDPEPMKQIVTKSYTVEKM